MLFLVAQRRETASRHLTGCFVAIVAALFIAPGAAAEFEPGAPHPTLDVPYLPQTEALCGGAATAMLFRYWGDRHADVQQFAPLVDRAAGGIAGAALIDAVRARRWLATPLDGSIELVRRELEARRPPMLLIEDRPGRYHYVIAVAASDELVTFHDPAWGPFRRMSIEELQRVWAPTGFWMLRVTPGPETMDTIRSATGEVRPRSGATADSPAITAQNTTAADQCDRQLDEALNQIEARGMASASALLEPLVAACPEAAGPRRELAAVRFSQKRWADAASLAQQALDRAPGDAYAADVLASSRFMLNDFDGALRAWNREGKPQLDSVRISGLTRTRYAFVAQLIGLAPNTTLTTDAFRLARRRLESLPDLDATRVSFRPADEGWAVADIAVVERATIPRSVVQWVAAATQAAIDRDISLTVPGPTGQGETWTGDWGFWEHRPRAGLTFAAPRAEHPNGVWRAGIAWQEQTYGSSAAAQIREGWLQGQLALATWLNPDVRLEVASGLDAWTLNGGAGVRTAHIAGAAERRFGGDRGAVQVAAARWFGLGNGDGFGEARVDLSVIVGHESSPVMVTLRADGSAASERSPMGVWNGAGEGRARPALLRAHTLLQDGRVDGAVFGRRLAHATVEGQHWFDRPRLVHLAAAVFADGAAAAGRPSYAVGPASQIDVGGGLRVRVPGRSGVFRIDYAHGLRDNANVVSVGWQGTIVLPAASPTP
jgi:hypothetical protein